MLVFYTDGSILAPGSNGSSSIRVRTDADGRSTYAGERRPIGGLHTTYETELDGIALSLARALAAVDAARRIDRPPPDRAIILADNQAAITAVASPRPVSGQHLSLAAFNLLRRIRDIVPAFELGLVWVPGHEGVHANEIADQEARLAAKETSVVGELVFAAQFDERRLGSSVQRPVAWLAGSIAALRTAHAATILPRWRAKWRAAKHGRDLAAIDPSGPGRHQRRRHAGLSRAESALITQIRTDHVGLAERRHTFKHVDSSICRRCDQQRVDTRRHFLVECPALMDERRVMWQSIPPGRRADLRFILSDPAATRPLARFMMESGVFSPYYYTPRPAKSRGRAGDARRC